MLGDQVRRPSADQKVQLLLLPVENLVRQRMYRYRTQDLHQVLVATPLGDVDRKQPPCAYAEFARPQGWQSLDREGIGVVSCGLA